MAIKKKWSIPNGDNPFLCYFLALCGLCLWLITLGATEMEITLVGEDKPHVFGGWWYRFFPKKEECTSVD